MNFCRPVHLPDKTLVLAMDGELSTRRQLASDRHLSRCARCRSRLSHLESAAREGMLAHRFDQAEDGQTVQRLRARLQRDIAGLDDTWGRSRWFRLRSEIANPPLAVKIGTAMVILVSLLPLTRMVRDELRAPMNAGVVEPESLPIRAWTPGAAKPVDIEAMCAGRLGRRPPVPWQIRQTVLRRYEMEHVASQEYELDYLITPELGGLGSVENLWPERSTSRVWNARVKDDLEQMLPQLVCQGMIDLETAQRELADDWIAAYKRYFKTGHPLVRTADQRDEDDEPIDEMATNQTEITAGSVTDSFRPHAVAFQASARFFDARTRHWSRREAPRGWFALPR